MIVLGAMMTGCDGSSDGSEWTARGLPAAAFTVSRLAASAVMVTWEAPTENTNGTPLMDLSGYTIHYGTQSQSYTSTIAITNPGLTTYVVDNLTPGIYYFAITASASDGFQSGYSPEVSVTVN
jgi:Fibronectin type III domain